MRGLCGSPSQMSDVQWHEMNEIKNKTISRTLIKAARWQLILTVLISGISLLVVGMNAAISAMAGGASVIVGGLAVLVMVRRFDGLTPGALLMSMLKAEAIKVLVIVILLLVTFKFYQGLVPLFLILGLAGSALVSGAGLRAINNTNDENE